MPEKYFSNECLLCSSPVPAKQPDCYTFSLDPFSKVNNFKELFKCLQIDFPPELSKFQEMFDDEKETSCETLLCTSCYPLIEDLGLMYGDLRRIQKRIDYRIAKIQQVIRRNVSVDIDNQKPGDLKEFVELFRDLVKEVNTPNTVSVVSAVTEVVSADDSLTTEIIMEEEQNQQQCDEFDIDTRSQHDLDDFNPPSLQADSSDVISTITEHITRRKKLTVYKTYFDCVFCQKSFQKMNKLEDHISSHTDERPHFCKKCDKWFGSANSLRVHMKGRNGVKRQQVSHRQTRVASVKSIGKPQKKQNGGTSHYKCNLCPKSFKRSISLYEHMSVHTGEKPYQCDICQGRFGTNGALTYHVASHSGTKPYECIFCSKRFPTATNLQRHIQRKIEERWYPCGQCDISFSTAYNLKDHLNRHNNVKLYKCDLCDKAFVRKLELSRHQSVHTREEC